MFAPQSKHFLVIFVTTLEVISWLGTGAFPTSDFTNSDATIYLKTFGWLDSNYMENVPETVQNFRKSLEEFQEFQGLPTTGQLDTSTIEIMKSPRCGVSDKPNGIGDALFEMPKWEVLHLTYKISKYPRSLQTLGGPERIDEEIKKAFAVWEAATPFTFTPSTDERVDINIRFEMKQHTAGHNFSFDVPAMNLAYASNQPAGVIYFNDEVHWTSGSKQGINFLQVAVHEIGHVLGLGHSNVGNALMFPIYNGYLSNFQLNLDDAQKIEGLYGSTNVKHPNTQSNKNRVKRYSPNPNYRRNNFLTSSEESGPQNSYHGSSYYPNQAQNYGNLRNAYLENVHRTPYPSSGYMPSHQMPTNQPYTSPPRPELNQGDEDPLDFTLLITDQNIGFGPGPVYRRPGCPRCPVCHPTGPPKCPMGPSKGPPTGPSNGGHNGGGGGGRIPPRGPIITEPMKPTNRPPQIPIPHHATSDGHGNPNTGLGYHHSDNNRDDTEEEYSDDRIEYQPPLNQNTYYPGYPSYGSVEDYY
ncbi:unnamed protein product [Orchesella dallaii]|uniref:Peptidase metallopeptidase domain-containing protein n=1 Tax=Orchesella dallaii TaxID=48710 RepID=A0ABP1RZB9_9HEXA